MLDISHMSLKFGGLTVLNDVTLSARAGEITALIGPNGAGKSALLNCISGHYLPLPETSIKVGGHDVKMLSADRRARAGISRTFQHIHLIPELTVLENIITGLTPVMDDGVFSCISRPLRQKLREQERHRRAREAVNAFGLDEEIDVLVGNLPLGIQRRVDFVRATMSDPKVLLLDEPASGMSRSERALIPTWIAAAKVRSQCAIVWIEHDIDLLLSAADAVVVLQQGEVAAYGRPKENNTDRQAVIDSYFGYSK